MFSTGWVLMRRFSDSNTVDGSEIRPSPVEVGSLSHYLQGFIHPRWLFGIYSIHSISKRCCASPWIFLLQEYGSGGAEVSATRYLGEIGVTSTSWLGDQGN